MPKTPAEHQVVYQRKHLHDADGTKSRINLMVDHKATLALSRLAVRYGVTHWEPETGDPIPNEGTRLPRLARTKVRDCCVYRSYGIALPHGSAS